MIAQALANAKEFSKQSLHAADTAGAARSTVTVAPAATPLSHFLTFGDGSPVDIEPLEFAAKIADEFGVDIEVRSG
jgi:hypothetical protein